MSITIIDFAYAENPALSGRDNHVAYRKQWKASYRNLSAEIRAVKHDIAQTFKDGGYAGSAQNDLISCRADAFSALEQLAEAKKAAQARYLEEKAASATEVA